MIAVEVVGASISFGAIRALDQVSLNLKEGEVLAVIGPNGSGKTTLINAVSGAYRANEGTVRLLGHDVTRWSAPRRARAGLRRTFQNVELIPELSVAQNVMLGAPNVLRYTRRMRLVGVARECREVLARVGLDEFADEPVGDLPFGVLRSVEVARALLSGPRILLLDEPTSGMDDSGKALLGKLFRQLAADGMAVLLVEHDVPFVSSAADSAIVLDTGRVIFEGSPSEAYNDPEVKRVYLGGLGIA